MNETDDKLLYKSFLNGDMKAFEDLTTKYRKNLISFIYRYVKNLDIAEDIFQDVILYLINKKEIYNFNYSFKTFLYTIARSKSLNYIRDQKSKYDYSEISENLFIDDELLENTIIRKERNEEIKKVFQKLNKEYQEVIYFTQIEELSYIEVSEIMGKSVSQIKNLVHRARIKLKKLLIEEKVFEMKKSKILKLVITFGCIGLIVTGGTIASKNLIMYNEQTGKPIIFAGQDVPEELNGKEVTLAVPKEPASPDYFPSIEKILSKYHNSQEVSNICSEAQEKGWGNEDILTKEGGAKLYYLISDVFNEGKITDEDKKQVLEYIQYLNHDNIDFDSIDIDVLKQLFPEPEHTEEELASANEYNNVVIAKMKSNQTFITILYKYYDKDEIDKLLDELSIELNSNNTDMEYSIKIIEYMINLFDTQNLSDDEKVILRYESKKLLKRINMDLPELEAKIQELYK